VSEDEPGSPGALSADALDTLCQVSSALLGVAGFDGRLRWVNPALVHAVGFSRDELLAMPFIDVVHPDDVDAVVELLGALATEGGGPSIEIRAVGKDGTIRWLRTAARVVDDLVYFSAVDLTQERQSAEALAAANASLRLFGAGVAHDLRTLLSVIEGAAGQLVRWVRDDPTHADVDVLGAALVRNARRASIFVEALLAVAHRGEVHQATVGLATIVAGAADDVAADAAAVGGTIRWNPDLPTVRVNPVLLRATLANLFSNSLRYASAMTAPQLVVEAMQQGDVVSVSVSDNGPGIAAPDLSAVFEPFERRQPGPTVTPEGDLAPIPSGYGLGLALCRQVVEAHGGRMWAESAPGAGTTMRMELPAAASAR